MESMKLGYVIHYVPDVIQSVSFYEQASGLKRLFVHESGQFAQLDTGTTGLCFCAEALAGDGVPFEPVRPDRKSPGFEIGFVTSDVAAAFERAVAAGATAVLKPVEKPWGQTVSYVRDLNGFLVEICSPMGG